MPVTTRELTHTEFALAREVWKEYHGQVPDTSTDRIFGVFVNGALAATARFIRHDDGNEMDCVFTRDEYPGRGLAKKVVELLLERCGEERIYIHSTLILVPFYTTFGWKSLAEKRDAPNRTCKARLLFRGDGGLQCRPHGAGSRETNARPGLRNLPGIPR